MTTQKTFIKTHIVQQTKHRWQILSVDMLICEIRETGLDLFLMKISYNLTKKTTKIDKFEKCLKKYIINFKTKGYKLTNWFG